MMQATKEAEIHAAATGHPNVLELKAVSDDKYFSKWPALAVSTSLDSHSVRRADTCHAPVTDRRLMDAFCCAAVLVGEYCEGGDLYELIQKHREGYRGLDTVKVVDRLLGALEYLQSKVSGCEGRTRRC